MFKFSVKLIMQKDSHRSLKQSRARKRTKQTNDRATDEADPSITVQKINAYEMIGKTQQSRKKMNRQGCHRMEGSWGGQGF